MINKKQGVNAFHEAAAAYLALGWSVIPVKEKKPRLNSWMEFQTRRATVNEIIAWWTKWPDASVAVVTGQVSDLVVVDVDGTAGLEALKPYLNGVSTLTCTTPRGGRHFYFKHPGGTVPCTVGVLPFVDVRGDGGYVVAPTDGMERAWEDVKLAPAPVPPKLLGLLRNGNRHLEPQDWTVDIMEGERDSELARRTGRLLQVGMPASEVIAVIRSINLTHCKPPLADIQLQKIVASIAGREAAKPERRAEVKRFGVTTQRDMLKRYSEDEERWVIKDWLPEASCGLIVAPPGNFKTWLLMALAYAVGTGRDFLGHYPVNNKGPVLIVQQEDPFWMLENRLARMFNQMEPNSQGDVHELDCRFTKEFTEVSIFWHEEREFNLENKACLDVFEERIAELKPRLVLIDPLYSAVSAKDYMALGAQSMLVLKRLRDKYKTSFVIAHHTTVAGASSEDRATIWGSQFLNAWLEWGWRLPAATDKGNLLLRHFKSAAIAPKIRLNFNITDWSFNVEVDESIGDFTDSIEELILNGGQFNSERTLAKAANISSATAHRIIKKMGLKKDKDGNYAITE